MESQHTSHGCTSTDVRTWLISHRTSRRWWPELHVPHYAAATAQCLIIDLECQVNVCRTSMCMHGLSGEWVPCIVCIINRFLFTSGCSCCKHCITAYERTSTCCRLPITFPSSNSWCECAPIRTFNSSRQVTQRAGQLASCSNITTIVPD